MPTTPTQADIDHAVFVREAYRYVPASDATVKARNPGAREESLDTNLDLASATALAQNILAENHQPRAFQFTIEGQPAAGSLTGGPPSFVVNSVRVGDAVARKAFSETTDYDKDRTTYQVRG